MAQGQYIKVYHVLKDEYPGVWRSDAQLALFVRLLMVADKWWPEWAPVAHRNGAYRSLVECGLVLENQGATGYTIKGLGPERSKRSQHGRHAASMRWASSEHAQPMPSKAEQNKAEQMDGQSPRQAFMGWQPPPMTDEDRQKAIELNRSILNNSASPLGARRAAEHSLSKLEGSR